MVPIILAAFFVDMIMYGVITVCSRAVIEIIALGLITHVVSHVALRE
jgi:hypothetical protein